MQSIFSPQELKGKNGVKYLKEEFTLVDGTGVCRGVAWQQCIGTLKERCSYKFVHITVRSLNGKKYLSLGEMCTISEVEDIGNVVDDGIDECHGVVVKGEVVAVVSMESYISCRKCYCKIADTSKSMVACGKCAKMKLSRCVTNSILHVSY